MARRLTWIFDLDNTLHDAAARIFPAMHGQINAFLQREFGVDEQGANRMRQEFWQRYGTTLNGLMRHHVIHPRRLRGLHPAVRYLFLLQEATTQLPTPINLD